MKSPPISTYPSTYTPGVAVIALSIVSVLSENARALSPPTQKRVIHALDIKKSRTKKEAK